MMMMTVILPSAGEEFHNTIIIKTYRGKVNTG
jgi:hypothetical protein